jgi:dihydrolipoamide dehydrogenase
MLIALMYKDGTLDDLLNMIYIHPALPEAVRDAARDARQQLNSRT